MSFIWKRFAILGGQPPETTKVVLKIDAFEARTGTFNATLKLVAHSRDIVFKGRKVSERELALTRADDEKTQAHLFLRGDGALVGSWQQFDFMGFTTARIEIKVDGGAAK